MHGQTRTGLIPTDIKLGIKKIILKKPHQVDVPQYVEGMPMPLSLKPLGGLCLPFAKTCSVLCNHPASANIKKIIHKCRQKVAIADKATPLGLPYHTIAEHQLSEDTANIISVDLLMRYSNANSRPVTPTSTLTTLHTRLSKLSISTNRRCITPELSNNDISTRKKLILDLRRSHSQETLYWKPSSLLSPNGLDDHEDNVPEQKETQVHTKSPKPGRKLSARPSKPENKQKTKLNNNEEVIQPQRQKPQESSTQICINERDDFDRTDIRRGKKRKKIKPACTQITKTFYLNEDLETQVRDVKLDSLSPSNRGSLLTSVLPKSQPEKNVYEDCEWSSNDTFLTEEAFRALALELDLEKIENHFETYLNLALQEAYKFKCLAFKPLNESKSCIDPLGTELFGAQHNKIPRKFSKSATRFLVPMNLKSLEEMGVFTYLSTFVWISKQYKHIYMRVFHKYYELRNSESEEQLKKDTIKIYKERRIHLSDLHDALETVLEFYGNENNIAKVLDLLDLNDGDINFRAWCGIVAFAERLTLTEIPSQDHCDELEIEDFTKMEVYLNDYQLPEKLAQMFNIIRITHTLNNNENQKINR